VGDVPLGLNRKSIGFAEFFFLDELAICGTATSVAHRALEL
jgi:hypothetical protein